MMRNGKQIPVLLALLCLLLQAETYDTPNDRICKREST